MKPTVCVKVTAVQKVNRKVFPKYHESPVESLNPEILGGS